jgi:hypothetical protein
MLSAVISTPARFCVIWLMLGLLLAGCGGGGDSGPSNEVQSLRIEQFQADIRSFCGSGKKDLTGAADPLGTMLTAVDNLIKIYRDDPKATYKLARIANTGDKLRIRELPIGDYLTESAKILAKNCGRYGPDQARRLQSAVS